MMGRLRQAIAQRILDQLPGPSGAMALALVVGDQTALSKADTQAMRDSGLAHLLSISGLHIGLAAGLFFFLVRGVLALIPPIALRFPIKKWAAVAALLGAAFYSMLAGLTAPTERSMIMTGLLFLGILLDRSPFSMRSIAWAAIVVLLVQPDLLVGPSFQMSFFAVVGLIAAFEALRGPMTAWRRARRDVPDLIGRIIRGIEGAGFWLAGTIGSSFIATIMTAPFAIYHFNRLSIYGIAANMVAVPLTGFWIMPAGVAALVLMPLGFDGPFWQLMGWGCDTILLIARAVAAWPGAVSIIPAMPIAGLVAISFGLLWLCLLRGRGRYLAVLAVVLGFASIALVRSPDILVSDSAKLVAIKDEAGSYWLSSGRAERQTAETWLKRNGQAKAEILSRSGASAGDAMACDAIGCIYRRSDKLVSISFAGDALPEDCAITDAIVSLEPVRGVCPKPKLVIDRFDLFDNGAYALWIAKDGSVTAMSVAQSLGDRPWVLRRGPDIDDESPSDDVETASATAGE
jgi:competence protein ComEC